MYSMDIEYIYQRNRRIIIWNGVSKNKVSFAALIRIKQWEKQYTKRISSRRPASEDITTDFSLS